MALIDVRLDAGASPSSDIVLIERLLAQDAQPISDVFLYSGQETSSDVVLWNFGTVSAAAQLAASISCIATVTADLTVGGAGASLAADVSCVATVAATLTAVSAVLEASVSCAATVAATLTAVAAVLAASASCVVSATAELTVEHTDTMEVIEISKASEHNSSLMYGHFSVPVIGF